MYYSDTAPDSARNAWHASGLRWIGSLFTGLADYLERPPVQAAAPRDSEMLPAEEFIDDVKLRIQSRSF